MGFRPVDDSDLGPGRDKSKGTSSGGGFRPASLDDEPTKTSKAKAGGVRGEASGKGGAAAKSSGKAETGSKKKKKKKKRSKAVRRLLTCIKVFATMMAVLTIGLVVLVYCAMSGIFGDIGQLDLKDLTIGISSKVYYIDPESGEEICVATLSDGKEQEWVDVDEIPEDMLDAFVSIEDERFYEHNGFDLMRTSKATVMYLWGKVTGGGSDFGGSTITQQLIKNVGGDWENTPTRKIKEISQAVNLEKQLSKREILELYLNVINLSNGCYGVQTASMEFFGKPVSELNLAECACIAGITQNPEYYNPLKNPENNKEKQEIVLKKMKELGKIQDYEYEEAVNYKLEFKTAETETQGDEIDDYYIEYLTEQLTKEFMAMGYSEKLARQKVVMGGLKIITTVDPDVQAAIDSVYENSQTAANIFGYTGSSASPQSAMVILDAKTGAIRGMSGGLGKKSANLVLDRALIPRQPGSSIKPIAVYAPAIDDGTIHASTLYSDDVRDFDGWKPKNSYSGGGNKTVQMALQKSSNIIAAQVLQDFGVSNSYEHLEKNLGITSLVDSGEGSDRNLAPLALGGMSKGISPLEMAGAYTPFTNDGTYTKPHIYTKVYDREGNVLVNYVPKTTQALSPQTAYIMTQLLRRVVTSGTGTAAGLANGVFTAGKTGTTDSNKDKWFVGFSPNYICAVWHGYDTPTAVTSHITGSQTAFKTVMDKIHQGKDIRSISAPSGITNIKICTVTGRIASRGCSSLSLPFTSDNKPKSYCNGHRSTSQSSNRKSGGKSNKTEDEDSGGSSDKRGYNGLNSDRDDNSESETERNDSLGPGKAENPVTLERPGNSGGSSGSGSSESSSTSGTSGNSESSSSSSEGGSSPAE